MSHSETKMSHEVKDRNESTNESYLRSMSNQDESRMSNQEESK